MSDAFSERMRLIRLRRKIEKPRFRDELKLIPKWLVWTLAFLYVVAVVLAIVINLYQDGGQSIQPSQLQTRSGRNRQILPLLRPRPHGHQNHSVKLVRRSWRVTQRP